MCCLIQSNQSPVDQGRFIPMNEILEVAGQHIEDTAFRLPDGTINVERIHAAP